MSDRNIVTIGGRRQGKSVKQAQDVAGQLRGGGDVYLTYVRDGKPALDKILEVAGFPDGRQTDTPVLKIGNKRDV